MERSRAKSRPAAVLLCRADGRRQPQEEQLILEVPLTIRVNGQRLLTVCRTPGGDDLLVAGVLFLHGLLEEEGESLSLAGGSPVPAGNFPVATDTIDVRLAGLPADWQPPDLLAALYRRLPAATAAVPVVGNAELEKLLALPAAMAARQRLRTVTRAAHAVALFAPDGSLLTCQEDVGRNNTLDKALGYCLRHRLNRKKATAVFSGRINLEMALKINRAGLRTVVSVSAPTAAAVAVLRQAGVLYLGSVRRRQGLLYHGTLRD
ncbi:MAG: formate dehydrogenase accessory sulfurtransferase FdhD [Deltaproteobacteria bacterium]|nr:formate dehydrogenase accessory sulfurtransferase FdhD [Deltaproteobacteria bacterium]